MMHESTKLNKIFISYAHKDIDIVQKYIDYLQSNYFNFWYDKNLSVSDRWRSVIGDQIKSSKFFIAFYSSNYRNSAFCEEEFNLALNEKKEIISVKIEENFRDENANTGLSNVQNLFAIEKGAEEVFAELQTKVPAVLSCKKNRQLLQKFDLQDAIGEGGILPFLNRSSYDLPRLFSYLFAFLSSCKLQEDIPYFDLEATEVYSTRTKEQFYKLNATSAGKDECVSVNVKKFLTHLLVDEQGEIYPSFHYETPKKEEERRNNYHFVIDTLLGDGYAHMRSIDELFVYFQDLNDCVDYLYNSRQNYKVNEFTMQALRQKTLAQVKHICETDIIVYPKLSRRRTEELVDGLEKNPLLELIHAYDAQEMGGVSQDVYVYGEAGSGKIYLMKDFLEKYEKDVLYIDLSSVSSSRPSVIHDFIQSSNYMSGGFNFDGDSLMSYVLNHSLTVILYGLESLEEKQLSYIFEEIKTLSYSSRVIILSRKRNLVSKIFLNHIKEEFEDFEYYDIIPYEPETVKEILSEKLHREFEDEKVISLINSPSKVQYFLEAVLDENGKERGRTIRNSSDLLFSYLFDDESESISTKCKKDILSKVSDRYFIEAFNHTIDELFLSVSEWAFCRFIGREFEIDQKSFNFLEDYNLIKQVEQSYHFTRSEYEEYFIAYHLANKLIKTVQSMGGDEEALVETLKHFKNKYAILQFVGYYLVSENTSNKVYRYLLKLAKKSAESNLIATVVYLMALLSDTDALCEMEFDGLLTYIEEDTFRDTGLFTEIIVPDSVTEIHRAAFVNLNHLKVIRFGNGVEKIAPWTLINCPDLQTVRFGKSLREVHAPTITNCDSLVKIKVDKANPTFSSSYQSGLVTKDLKTFLFACAGLSEIVIPEETETIKSWAFKGMKKLTSLNIPKNLTNIATDFTDECPNLVEFTVAPENQVFSVLNRSMLTYQTEEDKRALFRLASGVEGKFTLPREIEVIGDDSISTCRKLTEIYIPDSVDTIGDYALADLENTTTIEFEDMDCLEATGSFILMCHNPELVIKTGEKTVTPNGFTLSTRKNTTNVFKSDKFPFDEGSSFDALLQNAEEFETYYDTGLRQTGFDEVEIYRYVDLYRNKMSIDNNYNVLLLGMVEYNYFLGLPYEIMFQEIEGILKNLSINCIILSRDLPCPKELLIACKDKICIYRSALGTSKISKAINKICKEIE